MRSAGAVLVLAVSAAAALLGGDAGAQELSHAAWKRITVAVLPVEYYGRTVEDLFVESPETQALREQAGRWNRLIERELAQRDLVDVISMDDVERRLAQARDFQRAVRLARKSYSDGVDAYRTLDGASALTQLDEAKEIYREVFADIVMPRELADVDFYRGLVLAEQDSVKARSAFRVMLMLHPRRSFKVGYQPPATEKILRGAALDVSGTKNKLHALWSEERLATLADELGIDVWVTALIDGPARAPVLRIAFYDHSARSSRSARPLALGAALGGGVESAGDAQDPTVLRRLRREIDAWHACAVRLDTDPRYAKPKRKRWFVDISYIHSLWLKHSETRQLLHSPGAQISVTYEPTSSLHFYGKAVQMATVSDSNGDLLDVFVTTRLSAGAGLTVGRPRFRFFARIGLELAASLSDIRMTTDVDCKHFGADSERCRNLFTAEAPAVWLGLNFALGARLVITRGWYATAMASLSSYALDPEITGTLNFPVHFSVGFGAPL